MLQTALKWIDVIAKNYLKLYGKIDKLRRKINGKK